MAPASSDAFRIDASAPGKLIFMGEHAVLHGRRCLVAAVSRRLHVTLRPRRDQRVYLSSVLGQLSTSTDDLQPREPFAFLLAALGAAGPLPSGCEIEVRSDFGHTIGLGSSGAVVAATLAAVACWRGDDADLADPARLHTPGLRAIHQVQGSGSGADLAASLCGGLLLYRADPVAIQPVPMPADGLPITPVYCGYKTPTPDVIARVEARRQSQPDQVDALYDRFDTLSQQAADAAAAGDLPALGQAMDAGQDIMAALDLTDDTLDTIVTALRADPGIHGAKISGSGLGDCVLGIGQLTGHALPWLSPALELEARGAIACRVDEP